MLYKNSGLELNYKTLGKGKLLLMIHGMFVDHKCLYNTIEESLGDKVNNYQRIYIDLPGMGASAAPKKIINADKLLNFLLDFINDVFDGQNFSICGQSYGGYLALGILNKLPNRVDKAIFLAPVIETDASQRTLPKKKVKVIEKFYAADREAFKMYKSLAVNITKAGYNRYLEEINSGYLKGDLGFQEVYQQAGYKFSFEDQLISQKIATKTLTILGRKDNIVGYVDQIQYEKHFMNLNTIILENAGHNLQLDEPEIIRQVIHRFL